MKSKELFEAIGKIRFWKKIEIRIFLKGSNKYRYFDALLEAYNSASDNELYPEEKEAYPYLLDGASIYIKPFSEYDNDEYFASEIEKTEILREYD
ncbi:hypothetical protein [Streptobacillus moniliformis]|uniref:hypothetical protein n=1 Tax=Streptobacillus moniliformis TaxID=34105 RepID=UPI0007E4D955|nr:hypothetical protein [Streptobacillus moniliformis]